MPKKLDDSVIVDELRESSLFFPPGQHRRTSPAGSPGEGLDRPKPQTSAAPSPRKARRAGGPETPQVGEGSTEAPAPQEPSSNGALPLAPASVVAQIQRSVQQVGSKPITGRLTAEEKQALDEFLYTIKQAGIITSGNEVARIALQLVIEDYRRRGKSSTIAKILTLLHPAS